MEGVALFFSVCGIYFLCLFFVLYGLGDGLRAVFTWRVDPYCSGIYALGIAWFMALGLRMLPSLWAYYANVPSEYALLFNGVLGFAGAGIAAVGFARNRSLWEMFDGWELDSGRWARVACGVVLALLAAHMYRSAVPWLDQDETAVYGMVAKLIGEGYVRQDLGIDFRTSYMVEASDAPALHMVRDTYLARGLRFVNLIFVASMLFSFAYWLCKKETWAWLIVASFLAVPESLAYLATSLKVDGTVFCLELVALMTFSLVLETWRRKEADVIGEQILRLSCMGVFFTLISVGARQSGVYCAFLLGGATAYLALRAKLAISQKTLYLLALVLVAGAFAPRYIFNAQMHGNPLYPFKGPWPLDGGAYENVLPDYQGLYNLQDIPPVIEQVYLVFHLALGVEARDWDKWLPVHITEKIPHAPARGVSMNWLSPAMLAIFVVPFFARCAFGVTGLGVAFVFLFVFWSLGVQYSRVFIAGSTLPLLIAGAIGALDIGKADGLWLRLSQRGVQLLLWLSAIVPLVYFLVRWIPMFFPHGPSVFINQEARLQANVSLLASTYGERGVPGSTELAAIDSLLAAKHKPRVMSFAASGRVVHVLFDHGRFSHLYLYDMDKKDDGELVSAWKQNDCALLNLNFAPTAARVDMIGATFPRLEYATEDGKWQLRCR